VGPVHETATAGIIETVPVIIPEAGLEIEIETIEKVTGLHAGLQSNNILQLLLFYCV
jgi:hypothetical protein